MFAVGLSETPVYRDGLTSQLSYKFLAVKPGSYQVVVEGNNRVKFYPNAQAWGVTDSILDKMGFNSLYNRPDYQGVRGVYKQSVVKLLKLLATQRGVTVVPVSVYEDPDRNTCYKPDCRKLHPQGSRVPALSSMPAYVGPRAK